MKENPRKFVSLQSFLTQMQHNMADKFKFTAKEREETLALIDHLRTTVGTSFLPDDEAKLRVRLMRSLENSWTDGIHQATFCG